MVECGTVTQEVFSKTIFLALLLWYSLFLKMTAQEIELRVWKLVSYLKLERTGSFISVVEFKISWFKNLDVTGKSREDDTILNLQLHKHFLGGNEKSKPKQLTISTDLITLRALEIKVPDVFYCFKDGTWDWLVRHFSVTQNWICLIKCQRSLATEFKQ